MMLAGGGATTLDGIATVKVFRCVMPYLLKQGVGAPDEPLRTLHLPPHIGDRLRASHPGHCGAHTFAEQPAFALKNQAAQSTRGGILRRVEDSGDGGGGGGGGHERHHQHFYASRGLLSNANVKRRGTQNYIQRECNRVADMKKKKSTCVRPIGAYGGLVVA